MDLHCNASTPSAGPKASLHVDYTAVSCRNETHFERHLATKVKKVLCMHYVAISFATTTIKITTNNTLYFNNEFIF